MIKKILLALFVLSLTVITGLYVFSTVVNKLEPEMRERGITTLINEPHADLKASQFFCTEFKPVNGEWINLGCKKNVITTAGLNFVELLMGVGANSPVKYLALGNGSAPTIASTTLDSEQTADGLTRATGTYYDLGNGWWEVNTTFTYTGSTSRVVNTTANFNATSSGTMYAGGTITTVTFTTNGDQLKLRHNFTFAEG